MSKFENYLPRENLSMGNKKGTYVLANVAPDFPL